MDDARTTAPPPSRPGRALLAAAAVVGLLHAAISAYWAAGGTWLLETLGERVLTTFDGRLWLLAPLVVVKAVAAVGPAWLDARRWPWRRVTRTLAWLAVVVLVGWGGANTVVGNLVLAGVVNDGGAIDRPAMIGHAWLWDPLFIVWGVLLACGLWRGRRAH
ncbi:DUF3995 domain-containing protein [Serinibacter arcticus]|uniref:DUF3995 domain-containing protein n=1 Tax=Serinibacter arcticus TaxID=1655435 RepID=A0A2U1ZVL5_9MICO|nr:DUF3995 domain-containing protein [Serinibacter arcticus]PWD51035.1 DUF3995 domain-containing protein [Serinibacter arcticus]